MKTHYLDVSRTTLFVTDVSMYVNLVLPLVHSVARCQKDFHPSHHSGMDLDYAAVNQEGNQ